MSSMSPLETARRALDRIAAHDAAHIWISRRDADAVLDDARAVERRLARGENVPLAGLTFAVKDNIDVAGETTTAAHPAFAHRAAESATVVDRLRDAGAVLIGKTNLDQFATGLVGTRSPFGAVSSAVSAERVSGGSSSGSAAAVGHGLVDFSLGTDTAGSGRVPAAFNRIVGVKPTLGLVPSTGVVPACPSYDTVSVFAQSTGLAARILSVIAGPDIDDPHSRPWAQSAPLAAPTQPRLAIPRAENLATMSPAMSAAFSRAVARSQAIGAEIVAVDITPMLEAATLLYDGGLVAERAWSFGDFLAQHDVDADPSVRAIAQRAMAVGGTDVIADQQRLARLTNLAREVLAEFDALLIPTAPLHPTHAQVAADPLGVNAEVGTFTNFVNLMDMCGVAVPCGPVAGEGEFGVTFVAPAFHDQVAVDLAARWLDEAPAPELPIPALDIAVFGAHLRGEPLNGQLEELGACYVRDITTAPHFRMLLVDGAVPRPAVVRHAAGAALPGELWRLPAGAVSALLERIAAPLALGPVELDDGEHVIGFTASTTGVERDITSYGGWRAYRASTLAAV